MANVRAVACVALLALAFTATTASDEKSEHVVSLGSDFETTVNDGNVWFIKVWGMRDAVPSPAVSTTL
jgi:hypothetical protein